MAIARPVTKTIISTTAFGIPVVDWINANTPTPWVNITLQNGWTTGGAFQTAQYRKIGDNVVVRGVIRGGTMGVIAFNLPAGYRPPLAQPFPTAAMPGSGVWGFGYGELGADGNYYAYIGGNSQFAISCSFSVTP